MKNPLLTNLLCAFALSAFARLRTTRLRSGRATPSDERQPNRIIHPQRRLRPLRQFVQRSVLSWVQPWIEPRVKPCSLFDLVRSSCVSTNLRLGENFTSNPRAFLGGTVHIGALCVVCATLAACSPVGSTIESPTSVGLITAGEDIKRGVESSAGIAASADPSEPHHSAIAGAESPETPLVSLVASLPAQPGFGIFAPEPIIGMYPVENQHVGGPWGVLVITRSGTVSLLGSDLSRGVTVFRLPEAPDLGALCPSGDRLAVASGSVVALYDPVTGADLGRFDRIKSRVTALDWSPDGAGLLVGAADGRVYRWRLDEATADLGSTEWTRRFERYIGHATTVSAVRYHPHGRLFFSGDWDGAVSAWRDYGADGARAKFERDPLGGEFFTRSTERMVVKGSGNRAGVEAIVIDRGARRLIAARQDGSLDLWGVRGLKMIASRPPVGGAVHAIALSEEGEIVATASRDGRVRTYRLGEGSAGGPAFQLLSEVEHPGARHLTFLRDGTLLAAEGSGKVVAVR